MAPRSIRDAGRSTAEIPEAAMVWMRQHAPFKELCQFGGWPDDVGMRVELCQRDSRRWIVNIFFDETIMEISECDVTRRERCGKCAVDLDDTGHPIDIHLLYPL